MGMVHGVLVHYYPLTLVPVCVATNTRTVEIALCNINRSIKIAQVLFMILYDQLNIDLK